MASITRDGKRYRAQVYRGGVRRSKTFASKQEAKDWAARTEADLQDAKGTASKQPFRDVLERYARERSVSKRGARWEILRIEKFQRDKIADVKMADLDGAVFADWRERQMRRLAPASVAREMRLLNAILTVAVKEWKLLPEHPMKDVARPPATPPRDRLPTWSELRRMRYAAGDDLSKATARAFHAFGFAMRTAMRAGEICALEWRDIDLTKRVAKLRHTKNGHPRTVPLSSKAVRMLRELPHADPVFALDGKSLDALFRKIKKRALVDGLTFHDSRAASLTALSKRVDILALARISGHRDLKMLNVYYRETPEDIAKRLG